jgi:hypothetical protein
MTAAQSARLIRKPLRIKSSSAPPGGSYGGGGQAGRDALALIGRTAPVRVQPLVPGQDESSAASSMCWKKTREESQIKDDPKKTAASGASAAH